MKEGNMSGLKHVCQVTGQRMSKQNGLPVWSWKLQHRAGQIVGIQWTTLRVTAD